MSVCATVEKKQKKEEAEMQSWLQYICLVLTSDLCKTSVTPSEMTSLSVRSHFLCHRMSSWFDRAWACVSMRAVFTYCMHPCICDYSECMSVSVCVRIRACACACGQNYRSVHPALPPSVLRQATGHFIHCQPLYTAHTVALFVLVWFWLIQDIISSSVITNMAFHIQ